MHNEMKKIHFKRDNYIEGLNNIVNNENSDLQYISYTRLIMDNTGFIDLSTYEKEMFLMIMAGKAVVMLNDIEYCMESQDLLYIPINERFRVTKAAEGKVEALLFDAPAETKYEPAFISFDSVMKTMAGKDSYEREVYLMTDPMKIKADRLILGYCWGMPGGWTGWPPHEHTESLEELYVFYDMPEPGYALQLLYEKNEDLRCVKITDGDAVAISGGYHPLVAAPGFRMKNVWVMAAKRPVVDRNLSLAKIQEEYK